MTKRQISLLLLLVMCLALVLSCAACWDELKPATPPDNANNNTDKPSDTDVDNEFNDYGMNVITVELNKVNITEDGFYNTLEEVSVYINTFHALPKNYYAKDRFSSMKGQYTAENKISCGGDVFYNREGLLPAKAGRTFTECDIGYKGGGRNALRIVFSSDWLIFYTDNHYAGFSIVRFV